jgi:hypothetical protein
MQLCEITEFTPWQNFMLVESLVAPNEYLSIPIKHSLSSDYRYFVPNIFSEFNKVENIVKKLSVSKGNFRDFISYVVCDLDYHESEISKNILSKEYQKAIFNYNKIIH